MQFTQVARRLGVVSAVATVVLLVAYPVPLTIGLLTMVSIAHAIRDPMFSIHEILQIAMMPSIVTLMVAVHAWAPARSKALSLAAVVFAGLLAGVTGSLHFVILTVSHNPVFASRTWLNLFVASDWPSYALDTLAWNVLFPLSMLFAAPVLSGSSLARWIRWLMIASGVLAFAGLGVVASGDMKLREIGVIGYGPVFLAVSVLLAILFYRSRPVED
jgi:hypothetical protein